MFYIILAVHCALCVMMVFLVLLQQGKGADLGAAFGSGSSNSIFGAGGPGSFITRLTTGVCIGFMITSILLVRAYAGAGFVTPQRAADPLKGSVMDKVVQQEQAGEAEKSEVPARAVAPEAPAEPAAVPVVPAEEKE